VLLISFVCPYKAPCMLLPFLEAHWPEARAIYEAGIATGTATFTTEAPTWDEWHRGHLPHSRLVAVDAPGRVRGWAALSAVSGRCLYGGVAEVSVYVGADARGQGIGRLLLTGLVAESEQHGMWTLQAGIFPENAASLRLHQALGFRVVGRRERIGQLRGRWQDTLLLERRSAVVGV
jgi:L-amino acid N-acyltransferase YncA